MHDVMHPVSTTTMFMHVVSPPLYVGGLLYYTYYFISCLVQARPTYVLLMSIGLTHIF